VVCRLAPQYQFRRLWYVIAFLLVIVIVVGSLWHHPPKILFSFKFADKLMHAGSYFILMFWYVQLIYSYLPRLMFALIFIAMGVSLEYFQAMGGYRLFDWYDAIANGVGVILAFSLGMTKLEGSLKSFERSFLTKRST